MNERIAPLLPADRRLVTAGIVAAVVCAAFVMVGYYRPTEQSPLVGLAVAIVAAAAAAGSAYLAVVRPWWGVVAVIGTHSVVNMARADIWIGPVQVITVTPLLAALVVGVLLHRSDAQDPALPRRPVTWLFLALAAVLAVAATLAAPLSEDSINITLHGVLEPMIMLAIVLALRPDARAAVAALAALATAVLIAGVVNIGWLQQTLAGHSFYERRMMFARLTYFNVGIFGILLVMTLPAIAALILVRRRMGWPAWVAWLLWGALGLAIVALFYTYTKSAWVSAAVALTVVVLLLVHGWWRRVALVAAIYLLLAVVVPYPAPLLERIAPGLGAAYHDFVVALQSEERVASWDPETEPGSGSVAIRWVALGASAELAYRHPVLGVGPGRFGPEFRTVRPSASVPNLSSAHNFLPNVAVEYGLPLAILVTFAIGFAIVTALPAVEDPDRIRQVTSVAIMTAIFGVLTVTALFGMDLYRSYRTMNSDVLILATLLGLALSLRDWRLAAGGRHPLSGGEGGTAARAAG